MTRSFALTLGAALIGAYPLSAAFTVTLTPSVPSPQPVGTSITWTASVFDSFGGIHLTRFSVGVNGGPLQVRRDYAPSDTWTWVPSSFDDVFSINVSVKSASGATISTTDSFTISSRVVNGVAVVTPTANPLVALFSGPACLIPNSMRVRFQLQGSATSFTTNLVPCRVNSLSKTPDLSSMNFQIAGMYPNSTYNMHWETVNGGVTVVAGSDIPFTTGAIPPNVFIPTSSAITPAPVGDTRYPVLLQAFLTIPVGGHIPVPAATDLAGNVLWYYPVPVGQFGRVELGGNMLVILANADPAKYLLREIDLAGNAVLETNVARVNTQLAAAGHRKITGFHHEARRIVTANGAAPNGDIITLGTDDISSTSAQGGKSGKPVDIIGDQILVLDSNLQLKWSWDAFDHLDIKRAAPLGETCAQGAAGCEPFNASFAVANDWLHSNSVQYTPYDGNLLLSMRNQDWVIKIRFTNGTGDGHVLWRLGLGGDFIVGTQGTTGVDVGYPWFSHQHDANFALNGATVNGALLFTVFDDGNTRKATFNNNADSRCQLFAMNEATKTVNLNINIDVLSYSAALGSAQLLLTGNIHCDSGFINGFVNGSTNALESQQDGTIVYNLSTPGLTYRSFRMTSMYGTDFP